MSRDHTPGPWEIRGNIHGSLDLFSSERVLIIGFRLINQESNARLIAAAPDLLAELIALTEILEGDCDLAPCEGSDAPAEHHLGRAKRIIAQALGTTKDMNDGR